MRWIRPSYRNGDDGLLGRESKGPDDLVEGSAPG